MIMQLNFYPRGMKVIQEGIVASHEIQEICYQFNSHPDFNSFRYQLFIYQNIEDFQMSADEVRTLARMDSEASFFNPDIKVAIVTTSPLIYGMIRMYSAYARECQWETRDFKQIEDALHWLGITDFELV